jgi:hypothetical protein
VRVNASPLLNLLLWFGQFFLFVVGGALVLGAVFAWAGAWRGWARPDSGPRKTGMTGTVRSSRTTSALPFTLGLLGVALCAWGVAIDGILRGMSGLAGAATVVGAVFAVLAGIGTRWWPTVLMPRWHREQVRRGGGTP